VVPRSRTAAKTSVTGPVAGIDDEFRADLGAGDQILVGDLVDDVAHEHRAGSEEQVDGINEVPGDVVVGDVADDGDQVYVGLARRSMPCATWTFLRANRRASRRTTIGMPSRFRYASVEAGRLGETRKVGRVDSFGVDHHDVADTEPGELLNEEHADAACGGEREAPRVATWTS
jgi:hypothetical protein